MAVTYPELLSVKLNCFTYSFVWLPFGLLFMEAVDEKILSLISCVKLSTSFPSPSKYFPFCIYMYSGHNLSILKYSIIFIFARSTKNTQVAICFFSARKLYWRCFSRNFFWMSLFPAREVYWLQDMYRPFCVSCSWVDFFCIATAIASRWRNCSRYFKRRFDMQKEDDGEIWCFWSWFSNNFLSF